MSEMDQFRESLWRFQSTLDDRAGQDLPVPYQVQWDGREMTVSWHVDDDLTASKTLLRAFSGWASHPASVGSMVVVEARHAGLKLMAFVHPGSVRTSIEVAE